MALSAVEKHHPRASVLDLTTLLDVEFRGLVPLIAVEAWKLQATIAALFLVNGVPHFTNGVSGRKFPTAFSGGPGTEDTPLNNVMWGGANLIVGGVLLWLIRDGLGDFVLVAEMVVIGFAFACLLGSAFGNPERYSMRRRKS